MQNEIFNAVQLNRPNHNVFDLTHDRKLSTQMGKLTPIFLMETVPGDKISIKSNAFVRFAPLVTPVMHQVKVYMHFFFVPNRILWKGWEQFITGGEDGQQSPAAPFLRKELYNIPEGSLEDYFGIPVALDAQIDPPISQLNDFSALPFAAYNLIWNEYYRDQNLQQPIAYELNDGDNTQNLPTDIKLRAWQKDYFTSALPFTQRGAEAMLPLGNQAPIFAYTDQNLPPGGVGQIPVQKWREQDTGALTTPGAAQNIQQNQRGGSSYNQTFSNNQWVYVDLEGTHYTDLANATAASIIDVRRAFKLQEYLELSARTGARYTEYLKAYFNVNSSDARLQRPEYMGGFNAPVKISEVLQTSQSAFTGTPAPTLQPATPQGNMAGHGVSVGSGKWLSKYCEEHGLIIGIMSITPKPAYQQGLHKMWRRFDKFDYFTPQFQHIGEQPIARKELYVTSGDEVFGYTPRYSEYKFINSSVHGQFRQSLDKWHLGRKFASEPALNADFIQMNPTEVTRIFAVEGQNLDNMWCHVLNEVKASRPMAYFGNPKF